MNSSVTFDSAISVTSSLCLPMSCRSRSNGPSKLVSLTVKRAGAASSASGADGAAPVLLLTDAERKRPSCRGPPRACEWWGAGGSLPAQPMDENRVVAALAQVGEDDGDRLTDDPATVGRDPVLATQGQPGGLQREELVGGDVDGDLLVVLCAVGPAAGRPSPGGDVRLHGRLRRRAERRQLVGRAAGHQGEGRLVAGLLRAASGRPAAQRR